MPLARGGKALRGTGGAGRMARVPSPAMNKLYYGDNLGVLRDHKNFPDECVDLIYLDPPFNSKRDYNLLFKSPKAPAGGEAGYSAAQIEAFEDTWHWSPEVTEREYDEVVTGPNSDVSEMMQALVKFLGRNDMTAYLVMMANRLLELHRVLKPTGSLYLHCDPTASHYLKIVLDAVFGNDGFQSEIIWKRTGTHSSANRWGPVHDVIYFYTKGDTHTWNRLYIPLAEDHRERHYRKVDAAGRRYTHGELTAPGKRNGRSGVPWKGFDVNSLGRHWMTTVEKLDELFNEGRIYLPDDGSWPRLVRYEDEGKGGRAIGDTWVDIPPINMQAKERLGYPTQKPLTLLERIVSASSNPGDVVLDPFCGCGTAVHAAQKLGRQWLGIDITCLAVALIESRLKKAFPEEFGATGKKRLQFEVVGTPKDLESARDLARRDKYQFQWWAVSLIDEAQPWQGKKKGADTGIDGVRYFRDLDRKEVHTILISVKGGENVGPAMVKDLIATVARDKADVGLFISLAEPTKAMTTEAAAAGFYTSHTGKKYPRLQLLTIAGLLDGTQRAQHPDYEPDLGYKKAKAEKSGEQGAFF